MKKIFITISRGMLARNFLQNDFYKILRDKYEIVILTPAYKDQDFLNEFSHPNVKFVDLQEFPWTPVERIVAKLHKILVFSESVSLFLRHGIPNMVKKSRFAPVKFLLSTIIFKPLSKIGALKVFMKWVDMKFLQKEMVHKFRLLIKKEKPSLIVCFNIMSDTEIALIKAARLEEVKVWAMPKSWDNLGNYGFRAKPDKLLVWNEFMKEQAIKWHNYKPFEVSIIGLTQLDKYLEKDKIMSRNDYCKMMGLDSDKKIILFASEGKNILGDADIAQILYELISNNNISVPSQLLIRPHFAYKNEEKKFEHLLGKRDVVIDSFFRESFVFKDRWDYRNEFNQRFMNILYYSDVIVNTASTLSIDASIFDRPIVSIAFDGYKKLPFDQSVLIWYETDHVKELVKTGGLRVVYNKDELLSAVNAYLQNPHLDKSGRENMRKRFCHNLDGKSGQCFANLVIDEVQ